MDTPRFTKALTFELAKKVALILSITHLYEKPLFFPSAQKNCQTLDFGRLPIREGKAKEDDQDKQWNFLRSLISGMILLLGQASKSLRKFLQCKYNISVVFQY